MGKTKTALSILRKLAEESKAVKPIVKGGEEVGQALMKEGQLAPSQKIVQKLISSEDYANKMNSLKKAAGVAGAIGASSLISQEEAEAAGIATIMKKLGVAKEVAQEIKTMAKNVPPDVFEQNIKAIQDVSRFKKDPLSMEKLGSGISAEAFDAGDKVVKVPRLGKASVSWNAERNKIIPSVMEEQGFGPKTKTIETSKTNYQVQDKLTPLEDLAEKHPVLQNDETLNALKDEQLRLRYGDGKTKLTKDDYDKMSNLRHQIYSREKELLQNIENSIPEQMRSLESDKVEDYLINKMQPQLKDIVEVRDLHSGNVGLDPNNQVKAFDTGNFMGLQKENLTPEMRRKVLENYIASPEKKAEMIKSLNQLSEAGPTPLERLRAKKAAAIAPVTMGGELGQQEQQFNQQPEPSFLDKAKNLGISAISKGVDAYGNLSPDTKNNIEAGMNVLSQPSAALRGATYAAQKDVTDLPSIYQGMKSGWNDPETAPTGYDIAEGTGISDEYPGLKAGLATAADFADPIDLTLMSKLNKLKALGKLK